MIKLHSLSEKIREMERELCMVPASEVPVMNQDVKRMLLSGGKRLRPSLAYLCYEMGEEQKLPIMPLMVMLELMHTASLIHDDVVDGSRKRRGVPTIYSSSGIPAAVQSGDYLLAKAMEYLHIYQGTGINEALAEISTQMCLGEFQQMRTAFSIREQTKENYYVQIKRKTAYLIATSCYTGALAGGLSAKEAIALERYGENIGIAFQLRDDILDFTGGAKLGKPLGQDLMHGIFTLPLFHAFQENPDPKYRFLAGKRKKNRSEIKTLVQYVIEANGIAYTEYMIQEFTGQAVAALADCPSGESRDMLEKLAEELTSRKK